MADNFENAKEWAAPKVENALNWAGETFQDGVEKATPLVQRGVDKVSEALEAARTKVVEDYAPAATEQLAQAAEKTANAVSDHDVPAPVQNVLETVTGDKKASKKLKKALEKYTKSAEKTLQKQHKKAKKEAKKSKAGNKVWIFVGLAVAASGAAFAIYRLTKPVEDPWKNPTPQPIAQGTPATPGAQRSGRNAEQKPTAQPAVTSETGSNEQDQNTTDVTIDTSASSQSSGAHAAEKK